MHFSSAHPPQISATASALAQALHRQYFPSLVFDASADPWPPFEGAGVRFKGTLDGPTWRGEIAIPWKAIDENFDDPHRGRPIMLRFNFTQHKTDTGESASWAGPIDSGRDDAFMGLLYIRDTNIPGMAQQGR